MPTYPVPDLRDTLGRLLANHAARMNAIVKAGLWSMSIGLGIAIGAALGGLLIWLMILLKIG